MNLFNSQRHLDKIKNISKEYKDVKKKAEKLIMSFQTPDPMFVRLTNNSQLRDSIEGEDDRQAFLKDPAKVKNYDRRFDIIMNMVASKNTDPKTQ